MNDTLTVRDLITAGQPEQGAVELGGWAAAVVITLA